MRILVAAILASLAIGGAARAAEPGFAAGRPGQTEGPNAVPKGYLQIETEIASYAHDEEGGDTSNGLTIAATTLRYGLAHGVDAEMIVAPYLHQDARIGGVKDETSGFGDVTLRLRRTFTGQDGGGPALAAIGFITLPTSEDDLGAADLEGGAILTGSFALSQTWGAAWTIGAAARSEGEDHYQAEFSGAVQINHPFTNKLGAYAELAAVRAEHDDETAATFDLGATYLVGAVTQLDAGVNFGITDPADDATVFVGWAHRF